MSCHFI